MTTKIEVIDIISRIRRVVASCKTTGQLTTARSYLYLVRKRYPFIVKAVTDMMCDRQKWAICVADEGKG